MPTDVCADHPYGSFDDFFLFRTAFSLDSECRNSEKYQHVGQASYDRDDIQCFVKLAYRIAICFWMDKTHLLYQFVRSDWHGACHVLLRLLLWSCRRCLELVGYEWPIPSYFHTVDASTNYQA